jgi:ribosomal protein S18 acetylase RimI-like enzyme
MLAPLRAKGSPENDKRWSIHGRLAGFAILWDRDKDGNYETVAHAWTAQAWRRQGIARRLLDEGRSRFAARQIAGPLTDDGAALARSCWPNARIVR